MSKKNIFLKFLFRSHSQFSNGFLFAHSFLSIPIIWSVIKEVTTTSVATTSNRTRKILYHSIRTFMAQCVRWSIEDEKESGNRWTMWTVPSNRNAINTSFIKSLRSAISFYDFSFIPLCAIPFEFRFVFNFKECWHHSNEIDTKEYHEIVVFCFHFNQTNVCSNGIDWEIVWFIV